MYVPPLYLLTTSPQFMDAFAASCITPLSQRNPWDYQMASAITEGICHHSLSYPSIGSGPSDPDPETELVEGERWRNCKGCLWRRPKTDSAHSRVPGECKYPLTQAVTWECPGCKAPKPRWDSSHTYTPNECKWATASTRTSKQRSGRHPREPRQRASAEPTARLQATGPDGELGRGDEELAVEPAASSEPVVGEAGSEPSSSSTAPANTRGPDRQPRERRVWTDSSAGPSDASDWSDYDIHRTMKALRSTTEAGRRRILRKLHIRWWHATANAMKRLLSQAGQPKEIQDLVDDICDTCEVCRTWSKPLPASIASVEVSAIFNKQVEADLMFYKTFIIFHLICRCTRWHASRPVS